MHNNKSPHRQRGIATILMVVLVGIAITAAALGIFHGTRSAQEKQVAVHAATHAQTGLWAGVEAFRLYLGALDDTALTALNGTTGVAIALQSGGIGTLTANNVTVSTVGGKTQVSAQIVNHHAEAKAAAAVGVVFEVNANVCPNCVRLSAALDFHDDLTATGQIDLDSVPTINVDGNIKFDNINITALESLNATGSVFLNSGVSVDNIRANGDVEITGSADVDSILTKGTVITRGGAQVDTIEADGDVSLYASSATTSVDSLAQITVGYNSGNHSLLRTGGAVELQITAEGKYSGTTQAIYAVDEIHNYSDAAQINRIFSEDKLVCPSSAWSGYGEIETNEPLDLSCTSVATDMLPPNPNPAITIPGAVVVDVMNPVAPFTLPTLIVDVFELKGDANYVIESEDSKIKVTIYNINGETNGATYYIGNFNGDGNKPDALCSSVDDNGDCICAAPIAAAAEGQAASCGDQEKYLCLGDSANGNCIAYTEGSNTFTISGTGIAPGVWWIDGNVSMNNGFNNATLLATGNIVSSGQYRGAAVNYGFEPVLYNLGDRDPLERTTPYTEMCEVAASGVRERANHLLTIYQLRFGDRYPSNLCDIANQTYFPIPTGNIALAAGGIRPVANGGDGTTYSGGDISIAANSMVYGITLAGGYFESGGGTTFFGYVAAAVQGTRRAIDDQKNLLSGNTKIILDTVTDFYSPNDIADMSGAAPCTSGCASGTADSTRLLWSKYL